MAEVGLVAFARVAMEVTERVIPAYRTPKSKHLFTQPQLLSILCLMRYEDWTFREAEVRLSEHSELRQALKLQSVPDYTTLYRFLVRLEEEMLQQALEAVIHILPPPKGKPPGGSHGETRGNQRRKRKSCPEGLTVAVDATGLAPGSISTFFVKRAKNRTGPDGQGLPWRYWLKWIVAVDVSRRLLLAQIAQQGPTNSSATLRPLVDTAHAIAPIGLVLADGEFDSEWNHRHVREQLKAQSIIPAKRGKATWKLKGVRAEMRACFPQERYGQRALIESVFSSIKRKLSSKAPGRTLVMQRRQALLLGLAYNLYRLWPSAFSQWPLLHQR